MAREVKIQQFLQGEGYKPKERRAIVTTFAPENLSARLATFFMPNFFVLQMCEESLVLIPISQNLWSMKEEIALEIPYSEILGVEIKTELLNYKIAIKMKEDVITLETQQKELSGFRSSGMIAFEYHGGIRTRNWHEENFSETLKDLEHLGEKQSQE